jgi:hypothetical protein
MSHHPHKNFNLQRNAAFPDHHHMAISNPLAFPDHHHMAISNPPEVINLYKDLEEYLLVHSGAQKTSSLSSDSSTSLKRTRRLSQSSDRWPTTCLLNYICHYPFTKAVATSKSGFGVILKRLGKIIFWGQLPYQQSCQNLVWKPALILIPWPLWYHSLTSNKDLQNWNLSCSKSENALVAQIFVPQQRTAQTVITSLSLVYPLS